jgi:hypothetical protein
MSRVAAVSLAVALSLPAAAAAGGEHGIDVIVPLAPYEHQRLHFFGRRHRRLLPGTVTINRAPYVCDLDRARFRDGEAFVAHVRTAHAVPPDRLPDLLLVVGGQVHFVGE